MVVTALCVGAERKFSEGGKVGRRPGRTGGRKGGAKRQTNGNRFGEERQWLRLPNESAQAYSGFRAYLEADPGKRSIAAAYRQAKGLPADATVRVPGYFGAWASRYRWQERGDAWDAFLEQLAAVVNSEELAAARKQTAELSARVMSLVEVELRRFESAPALASMDTAGRLAGWRHRGARLTRWRGWPRRSRPRPGRE